MALNGQDLRGQVFFIESCPLFNLPESRDIGSPVASPLDLVLFNFALPIRMLHCCLELCEILNSLKIIIESIEIIRPQIRFQRLERFRRLASKTAMQLLHVIIPHPLRSQIAGRNQSKRAVRQ